MANWSARALQNISFHAFLCNGDVSVCILTPTYPLSSNDRTVLPNCFDVLQLSPYPSFNISVPKLFFLKQVRKNSQTSQVLINQKFIYQLSLTEWITIVSVTDMEHDFNEARIRGLPYPVLYIAEYFTVDSEGLRWHRSIREAGHFVHILLW